MSILRSLGSIRCAIVALLSLVATAIGFAGTLPAPPLKEGQFVYRIPANFVPDKLSEDGFREIQRTAKGLHYPFYVIFVERLPTQTGSSTDDDTERAIVGLANDWARDARFKRNRATLFLVSYGPGDRKYKMLPAPLWRTELGLEHDALRTYTDIFRSNARKDPQSAMTRMMSAFDGHVYEIFDPARKAQRAEEVRRQQEAMRIAQAQQEARRRRFETQNNLRYAVEGLATLLREPSEYLPADLETYRSNLAQAERVRQGDRLDAMQTWTAQLYRDTAELQRYSARRRQEAVALQAERNTRIAAILVFSGLFGAIVITRGRRIHGDRAKVRDRIATWRNWITQARQRYYLFDENRERAPHLRAFTGRTAELFQATSREIDSIIVGVEAVAALLDSAEAQAKRATFWNRKPLTEALDALDKPVTFATDRISEKLFEPVNATVEITPGAFLAELSDGYDAAVRNWQALNEAVTRSFELPDALFPQAGLDRLLEKARQNEIPDRWLANHPLMGDPEADRTLYDRVNEARLTDPYAYSLQIDELRAREAALAMDLDRLIAAVALAGSKKVVSISGLDETRLHPEDDPQITFDQARLEERRVTELLRTANSVEAVEAQAETANTLYEKANVQSAAARQAMILAPLLLKQAATASTEGNALAGQATLRGEQAAHEHADVSAVQNGLRAGERYLESGARDLVRAEGKLTERRHLGAQRDAEQALSQFTQAKAQFESVLAQCAELDAMKARYEQRLREMERLHRDARSRVRRYNGSAYLIDDFHAPSYGRGPADFGYLMGLLQQQENEWNAAIRRAERAYEDEQRRRREQEEAERRHRQESLFSSSSSSSSFDHSSSSFSSLSDSGSSGGSFSSSDSGSSSSDSGSQGGSW